MILRHIRYMLAVAEHRNFTRAADALHVSQPALSQQIKQLEETLGVQLFDRTGRTVRLTDMGSVYIEYARRALVDLEAGRRAILDVRDLSHGELRLAMTPTFTEYLVAPLVERFSAEYPGITLSVCEMTLDSIELALSEDRVDLGIGFAGVRSDEIEVRALFDEKLTIVVGKDHPFARKKTPVSLQELADAPLALLTRDFATRAHIDAYFQSHRLSPKITVEANSISAVVKIVRYGRMATILPDAIAREHGALNHVESSAVLPSRTVALLSRKGAYRSAASQAFAALLDGVRDSDSLVKFIGKVDPE